MGFPDLWFANLPTIEEKRNVGDEKRVVGRTEEIISGPKYIRVCRV